MSGRADIDLWLPHAGGLAREGVGFLDVETDVPLGGRPEVADLLGVIEGAAYLGHLTDELLDDRGEAQSLLAKACHARRAGGALFASTPLSLPLLYGSETDRSEPSRLDVPAIVARSELAYLLETTCVTTLVGGSAGAAFLTPIEERMASALEQAGVQASAQVEVGSRRVDFLVEDAAAARRYAIECDGAGFHDPITDKARDQELEALGVETIRFTGSAIVRNANGCVARVKELLEEGRQVAGTQGGAQGRKGHPLSPAQASAANHRSGPARVAAPAGSGKTRVVEERVRRLVASGVEPSRICAISFTNAAVDEMRGRVGGLECRLTTVHSLAKAIAEERFGKKTLVQRVSPDHSRSIPSRWKLLKGILSPEERSMNRPWEFWVAAVASYRQSFEVPRFDDWQADQRPESERFLEICRTYDQSLIDRRLTDFEGFIHDALRALAADDAFRTLWAGRFDYWIVDEYQDLPKAKLWLLRLLAAPARNLFVVGDDDQVIFEFAGASGAIFSGFTEHFPDAREYLLDRNYRSPHDLVVRSKWMIERNKIRVEKDTKPNQPLEDVDRVEVGNDPAYDLTGVNFVRERLAEGCPPGEIAVLFRLRDMAIPLERLLQEHQIPFRSCARPSFFETRPVRSLQAWLRLTNGSPITASDFDLTLQWPPRYISTGQRKVLVNALSSAESSQSMARRATQLADGNFNQVGKKAIASWAQAILRTTPGRSPTETLTSLKLRDVAKNDRAPIGGANPVVVFDIFFRMAAQFDTTPELLAWISMNSSDLDYDPAPDEGLGTTQGVVTLATIHESKGKEWDHVAVLGPPDGMPDSRAETTSRQEEERRIAYVAFTRARKSVLFGCSVRYARELERRDDGLSWEDYREGRLEPTKPASDWDPWEAQARSVSGSRDRQVTDDSDYPLAGIGHVRKQGVAVIRPGQPAVPGEVSCACGARLFSDGQVPSACPECGAPELKG